MIGHLSRAAILLAASLPIVLCTATARSQVSVNGPVTSITTPPIAAANSRIDFGRAQPMPLPSVNMPPASSPQAPTSPQVFGTPGVSPGSPGTGQQLNPLTLPAPKAIPPSSPGVQPQEFGTSGQPYTTAQVDASGDYTASFYPFSAAGKLYFNIGTATFLCSASLITPGVVVTAAHCVANYGQFQFYSNWVFVPSYENTAAPYGTWTAASATILTVYYNGTDNCAVYGIICPDDVAVLLMNPDGTGTYPGYYTGWLGYGWNGYGANGSGQALINQLGYPVALDGGEFMERNDSQGFVAPSLSNNTIIGSLMTGGSSGGPWAVNLGMPPTLSGISHGSGDANNTVTHVTSWGYTDPTIKQQGASPFTDGNILLLVNTVCAGTPAAC